MLETNDGQEANRPSANNSTFIQDAFSLPVTDPNWVTKLIIGAGMASLFFLPFFWGYLHRINKRVVKENKGPQLPEWDDWNGLLIDGLKYMGAALVYTLPTLILILTGVFLLVSAVVGAAITAEVQSSDPGLLLGLLLAISPIGVIFVMLGSLISIPISILIPAGIVHMCAEDRFGAAFEFKVWFKNLKANLSGYLIAYAIIFVFSFVLSLILQVFSFIIIFCFVLTPIIMGVTGYYAGVVSTNLYANAYREGKEKLAAQPSNNLRSWA